METLTKYYKTKHWEKFRKSLVEDINAECEICKRKKWSIYKIKTKKHKKGDKKRLLVLTVHHKNYNHLYEERREDVLVLCRYCHDYGHTLQRLSSMSPDPYLKMYNLFKSITKWEYSRHEY